MPDARIKSGMCIYNSSGSVMCSERDPAKCVRCGWNPAVEKARREERRRLDAEKREAIRKEREWITV